MTTAIAIQAAQHKPAGALLTEGQY